jgi:hypothetical protein
LGHSKARSASRCHAQLLGDFQTLGATRDGTIAGFHLVFRFN